MLINAIYKICEKPDIYLGTGSKYWNEIPAGKDGKAYLLTHPMWHFNAKGAITFWKEKMRLRKRNIELVMLHNTPLELFTSRVTGLGGFFLNQNIHVCEHIFKPVPGIEKKYDAVYVASAKPYKRIPLAKKVKRLFIITYFWPDVRNEKGEWDLYAVEPSVMHADFNKDRIGPARINEILNESYCALALSKKEGAMFASMEYQMAGLPVVTTPSTGGRDVLMDPNHTTWVNPDPDSVATAVQRYVSEPLDPETVRKETLSIVDLHRRRFYEIVSMICVKHRADTETFDAFRERVWGPPNGLDKLRVIGEP